MKNESEIEFWRLPKVIQVVGLSRSEIYRQMGRGDFPKSRQYPGTNKSFWLAAEIHQWQMMLLSHVKATLAI